MSRKTAWLNLPLFVAVLALIVWWWWRETERQTRPAAGLMGGRLKPPGRPARPAARPYSVPHVPPAAPELAEPVAAEPEPAEVAPAVELEQAEPAEEAHLAEPQAEPTLEAEAPAEKAEVEAAKRDNLKRVAGIGPKIESVFQAAGILSYAQLADTAPSRLEEILAGAGIRLADAATWPEQAALAAAGDWQGLELLQSQLKGGRRVA